MSSSPSGGFVGDASLETGPYLFRKVHVDLPPSDDGHQITAQVTCAQFWDGNLYVGTSTAELLHFVQLPSDDSDEHAQPSFMFASRRTPVEPDSANLSSDAHGVQQIVILPKSGKACVLCNSTLIFYTLPELSPAYQNTNPLKCNWVGGVDLNVLGDDDESVDGAVVMICQKSQIRLVRISERPQKVQDVKVGGCINAVRRGNIACLADGSEYSLVDLIAQRKIPLGPISTVGSEQPASVSTELQTPQRSSPAAVLESNGRTSALASARVSPDRAHGRSPSLGILGQDQEVPNIPTERTSSHNSQSQSIDASTFPPRTTSLLPPNSDRSPSPETRINSDTQAQAQEGEEASYQDGTKLSKGHIPSQLVPHIASPTPTEFLIATGTSHGEPGVGMFVNLDAVPSRSTLQFASYPESLLLDGQAVDSASLNLGGEDKEGGYVLAVVKDSRADSASKSLEIQRWDVDPSEVSSGKTFVTLQEISGESNELPGNSEPMVLLHPAASSTRIPMPEIVDLLALTSVNLTRPIAAAANNSAATTKPATPDKSRAEASYIRQFSTIESSVMLSTGNKLWWAVRNPQLKRLEIQLNAAMNLAPESDNWVIDRQSVEHIFNELRGQQPATELQSFTLTYVRQKAALLLFMDLLSQSFSQAGTKEHDRRVTEEALKDAELDPRFLLSLLPSLSEEVLENDEGVWLMGGLAKAIDDFWKNSAPARDKSARLPADLPFLHLVKRHLQLWRRKKGLGSVPDGSHVFQSVDAALVRLLLHMDRPTPPGPGAKGSVRAELYAVVDKGVDCFDRVVELLEQSHRLYVLSRLYQSWKMSGHVLAVWRRIINGERDDGGDFVGGEELVRRYLRVIEDPKLVEEYGTWLVSRNPKVGVRVFADSKASVKFETDRALQILQEKAPDAVKDFLEHLVFDKHIVQHANDLINYYLDSVLTELINSEGSRKALLTSYQAYRALQPPKPTYSQFATDNAVDAEWWRNRLRLLQLLGGSHATASQYNVSQIEERISKYESELVPEMIVLHGKQGRHGEAIRLLTHGLGDFDTAVSYCVLGGSSTYSPADVSVPTGSVPSREQQVALFRYLLEEFIQIKSPEDRLTQTGELLERFAGWFDVDHVLTLLPDSWSIGMISSFLESSLRELVSERNESLVSRALTSTENLDANARVVQKMDSLTPKVDGVS